MIAYADKYGASIRPVYAISPAHANTSVLEAWFSLARQMRADSAISYHHAVGSRQLLKAQQALKNNPSYSANDVGTLNASKTTIVPREQVKFHTSRKERALHEIEVYNTDERNQKIDAPTPVFAFDTVTLISHNLTENEKDVLCRLGSKSLKDGFLVELLSDDYFRQWMRLSYQTEVEEWFNYLLKFTTGLEEVARFDKACQKIMDKLLHIAVKSMQNRKKDSVSFEVDFQEFIRSDAFVDICRSFLPKSLVDLFPGCVVLCLCLNRMMTAWLKMALLESRKKRSPWLFLKDQKNNLTPNEQNNEVNRFVGWAIFSSLKRILKKKASGKDSSKAKASDRDHRALLMSMMVHARDIDDKYTSEYYEEKNYAINT